MNIPNIYWIDLFCGAGGTSTGIHLVGEGNHVVACVNHDSDAIKAHSSNHPDAHHFTEDIRDFSVVIKLKDIVSKIREREPNAIVSIWASLECTNFSKAKGGQPRDADSRTLAEHMFTYLEHLKPDYFWVENVREFMSWGPLDEKGKPVSRIAGRDYIKWIEEVKSFGFRYDAKILNAADFGAYQSRERLFIQFAANNLPISWPEQTHTKDKRNSGLFPLEKWKPVRDVLDLNDEGSSIFDRKKSLSENTLKRILAGLIKFVSKGEPKFIQKYFSGCPESKVISVNGPAGTVLTVPQQSIVTANLFLQSYYGNGGVHDINSPSPTLTTKDRIAKVFIDQQYGNSLPSSVEKPIGTLTNNPKFALVTAHQWVMDTNFNNIGKSIEDPSCTIMASRRYPYLINANSSTCPPNTIDDVSPAITSRTHLLVNPAWGGHTKSIEEPSCTIVARQDKAPIYLLTAETGTVSCFVYENDSETMIKIKMFMVEYGITDIKMRMLNIEELKQIQGFPKNYVLYGNQTQQKKQIGNAVEVTQAKALVSSMTNAIHRFMNIAA